MTSVQALLKQPFALRPDPDKVAIVQWGKPRPNLAWSTGDDPRYRMARYARFDWLTACEQRKQLFCWPCLLFGKRRSRLRSTRLVDLEKHAKLVEHQRATIVLAEFVKQHNQVGFDWDVLRADQLDASAKEQERKKLYFYMFAIRMFIHESRPFRKTHLERPYGENVDRVVEFQDRAANLILTGLSCSMRNRTHLDKDVLFRNCAIDGRGVFADRELFHQTILHAIRTEMLDEIRHEVIEAADVAIELLSLDNFMNMGTMLRYVHHGNLVERFLCITLAEEKSTHLMRHLTLVVDKFGLAKKLVALVIDSHNINNEELAKLSRQFTEKFSQAIVTDSGDLSQYIETRLRSISEASRAFCEQILELQRDLYEYRYRISEASFGTKIYPKGIESLSEPSLGETCSMAIAYRAELISFFQQISYEMRLVESEIELKKEAYLHWNFLRDFTQIFLMLFFEKFWRQVETLEKQLASSLDSDDSLRLIKTFCQQQRQFVEDNLEQLWLEAVATFQMVETIQLDTGSQDEEKELDEKYFRELNELDWLTESLDFDDPSVKQRYVEMIYEITRTIATVIEMRYSNVTRTLCFQLLNPNRVEAHREIFPCDLLASLQDCFPDVFKDEDKEQLKNELSYLYSENLLDRTRADTLLESLVSNRLSEIFGKTTRLASLASTIPSPYLLTKSNYSSRDRVRDIMHNDLFFYVRLMPEFSLRVESTYCAELLARPDFQQRTITRFYAFYLGKEEPDESLFKSSFT